MVAVTHNASTVFEEVLKMWLTSCTLTSLLGVATLAAGYANVRNAALATSKMAIKEHCNYNTGSFSIAVLENDPVLI